MQVSVFQFATRKELTEDIQPSIFVRNVLQGGARQRIRRLEVDKLRPVGVHHSHVLQLPLALREAEIDLAGVADGHVVVQACFSEDVAFLEKQLYANVSASRLA